MLQSRHRPPLLGHAPDLTQPDRARTCSAAKYRSADRASVHIDEDYVIQLADGKRLDLAAYFGRQGKRFERQLRRSSTTHLPSEFNTRTIGHSFSSPTETAA